MRHSTTSSGMAAQSRATIPAKRSRARSLPSIRMLAGEYGLLLGGSGVPVIGHGSWVKDCRYASLYVELKREAGHIPGGRTRNA